ncbi:hypothetical protein [Bifidobacterium aerophilum]|uniref:PhnA protein n=1 Tax=Bifidobacterium aerophilum TaxID=1798155 RepID=A0A6N9Z7W0_9BIFI|nr:hypothetical protein [Bifidobacterium aerophilum]NEG90591.1 hypothetical protein [Bifidobacterium aerophilum]
MECQHCRQPIEDQYTLCAGCELAFCRTLIRLAADLTPLHDSLDATLHPGGHAPTRIQTATPPTPIRLDVLDLIDLLDATARELLHCLDGVDAHLDGTDPRDEDLQAVLWRAAGHPRLAMLPLSGMYYEAITAIARKTDLVLDPPEHRREIGTCERCETMLTAGPNDLTVTCPACGVEQRVQTVKLRRLERLCFDDSKRGSAAEIARAFTDAGITCRRNTISQWASRGKITASPQGFAYCDVYRALIAGVSPLE